MDEPSGQVVAGGRLLGPVEDIAVKHPEVEFALVLARTIDSISADPERLRGRF